MVYRPRGYTIGGDIDPTVRLPSLRMDGRTSMI